MSAAKPIVIRDQTIGDALDAAALEQADHPAHPRRAAPVEAPHQRRQLRRRLAADADTHHRQPHGPRLLGEGEGETAPAGE